MPLNVEQFIEDMSRTMTEEEKVRAARAILKDLRKYVVLPIYPEERKPKGSRLMGAE